jgi:hypothetical protein
VSASAELIGDGGAAASGVEFFRSPEFLAAEGATHTLRIAAGDRELLAPLVVRQIPNADALDAVSPYGYPGIVEKRHGDVAVDPGPAEVSATAALEEGAIDFSATGLVSIFIRHTLARPPLGGSSERNVVQVADPELPRKSRSSDRNRVNRNRRTGYEVRIVASAKSGEAERAGFCAAYGETMRRTDAADRYLFDRAYFDRLFGSDRAWLALALAPGGEVAAGSLTVESDGFLHYYLSGSTDRHLSDSPMKNVVTALVDLAEERGLPLNLGGGITRGDRLEEFKRGFANRELPWHTSEIVSDPDAYARLSAGKPASNYFPLYRSD